MRIVARALAALLVVGAPTIATAQDGYVYGPPPAWTEYKKLGEAAIRAKLPDPDSWVVEWPNGYKPGRWPGKGKPQGYFTCGTVRAIKPVEKGGYPSHLFVVVIDRGEVKGVDYQPKPSNSMPNLLCGILYKNGGLPPASMMEAAVPASEATALPGQSSDAVGIPMPGLSVRTMAEGAYVTGVVTGSAAAASGLRAGMLITKANGIALAGLGDAMIKLLASDTPTLALETVTGGRILITRASK